MQLMLESKALNLNPGSGGEYIIKKKNNIENNTQKLEQPDRNFEYKKSDSINGKRMSSIPLNESESDTSTNGRSNQNMPLINGPKKVKPNQEKFESKSTAPPAPEFKQTKQIIEIDSPQSQQALKKPPPEIQQSKRPPITQEYENSISYSQRPIQKNPNQMNREAFFQNKIKFLPHVKLRDSGFGNTFIPVLPSFLTEL